MPTIIIKTTTGQYHEIILPSSQYHAVIMLGDVVIIPDDVNLTFFNEINTIVTYIVGNNHDQLTTFGTVILPLTADNVLDYVSGIIVDFRQYHYPRVVNISW